MAALSSGTHALQFELEIVPKRIAQSRPKYSNILVLGPVGQRLNCVDSDRASWYCDRELAHPVEAPEGWERAIQLTFTPSGNTVNLFDLTPKANRCVVCGNTKDLTTHHVLPACIRKGLPKVYKSRSSCWCLLVCPKHHEEAEKVTLPLYQPFINAYSERHQLPKRLRHRFSYLRDKGHWTKIPKSKQQKLLAEAGYLSIEEACQVDIDAERTKWQNAHQTGWVKAYLSHYLSQHSIPYLYHEYRKAFLSIQPHFLPPSALTLPLN